MSAAGRPRVLLVEDDYSLQRFVQLALEDFDIELRTAGTVDAGMEELAQGPVALILTDLMLPDRSGFDLIDILAARPELQAGARLAVFSAGLTPATRQRLARPEVWRLLSKPCGLAELEACVRDALAPGAVGAGTPTTIATPPPADQQAAIAEHFGGDAMLYHAFRASCLQQFRADLAEGERALAQVDAPAMRRLAHSLKSVLMSLGHADAAAVARELEQAGEQADWPAIKAQWPRLREAVAVLR